MMTVDTSALASIALGETSATAFRAALESESDILIGAPILVELGHVLRTKGVADERIDRYVDDIRAAPGVRVVDFSDAHGRIAVDALRRYRAGKKGLNLLDAMAYAVAMAADAPLLFIGGDFGRTDVRVHPASVTPP